MFRWRRITGGEIAALLTVVAVAAIMYARGETMFSPGALNAQGRAGARLGGVTSHAEIGSNCAACHVAPWSTQGMADRCLACHTDVRAQLDTRGPLHGLLAEGRQCRTCHTEHKGSHAGLTDMTRFNHDHAAFKLTGKHRTVECNSCHSSNVFKGTASTCASCHAEPQVHQGRFGTSCVSCHSTSNWKDTAFNMDGLANFDHDRTGFKLTGKHRAVDCKSCHVNNVFKGTASTCVSCHAEPLVPQVHKVRHGTGCASCHSTDTWVGLVHKHTFPLSHHSRGRDIACATCHTTTGNYRAYTCAGCHAHEPTKMERKHKGKSFDTISNCVQCHPTGRKNERKRSRAFDATRDSYVMSCPETEPWEPLRGPGCAEYSREGRPASATPANPASVGGDYQLFPRIGLPRTAIVPAESRPTGTAVFAIFAAGLPAAARPPVVRHDFGDAFSRQTDHRFAPPWLPGRDRASWDWHLPDGFGLRR